MAESESDKAAMALNRALKLKMAEVESGKAARLQNKASETLKNPSSIVVPASKEPKSCYFLPKSLPEVVNEGPIKLQSQSCVIRKESAKILGGERLVYSSSARLPTFSIGLASTQGASLRENRHDPKDQSLPRYFQMPELGARVFVGDCDGSDTIACQLYYGSYKTSKFDLDSQHAAIRSLYEDDLPGGLSGWLQGQPVQFETSKHCPELILSGTELFHSHTIGYGVSEVGSLGGKSSRVSGSSSDSKDCTGDKSIRQPSDVVEQPGDPVPAVVSSGRGYWTAIENPYLLRSPQGSYLRKPEFMKPGDSDLLYYPSQRDVLQLTRFDDFVILGNEHVDDYLLFGQATDIVRENASETADVIAAQLVKSAMKGFGPSHLHSPITAIVILLDHKEILLREQEKENMTPEDIAILSGLLGPKAVSQSIVLRDDKVIAEFKEEEKVLASEIKDKKGIMMKEDRKLGMESTALNSNLTSLEVQDDSQAPSSIVFIEDDDCKSKDFMISCPITKWVIYGDLLKRTLNSNLTSLEVQDDSQAPSSIVFIEDDDCKSKDFMISCPITKWVIYGDLLKRTLLCFFNVKEEQYEFYFEDHESMATIIGVAVPHSKVILECGSPHVTVVEILEEDWAVMWAHSIDIPPSIPEDNVLKQEIFPDILHRIANIISIDNIISKANDGGAGGDNGKDKAQSNVGDNKGKGKAHDHDNHGNTSHPNGGSNGASDDNDKKEKGEKDGNNEKNSGGVREDGKTFKDGKKVQATVYLRLLPGGILEEKEKQKGLVEVHKGKGKKRELEEGHIKEDEGKKKKHGEVHENMEKKKKNNLSVLQRVLTRSENCNIVGNQQKSTIITEVGNVDVDDSLDKQLEEQIHAEMKFTFTIKDESGGQLKTIQAIVRYVEFQLPSNNEENYLERRRFGWFHDKLQVAFGAKDTQVAILDPKSRKALDCSEVEETNSWVNSKENASTSANAYKGRLGYTAGVAALGEYTRTNGLEAKTTEESLNSSKSNIKVTKGDFFISDRTNLKSQQLRYVHLPRCPFNEGEFEKLHDDDRLRMYYLNPICQSQQVSCEGTWYPSDSKKLEAYKLEASRELRMTRIYNSKLETIEEKKKKETIQKAERNRPLCLIQKLEKVMYLNHAMSHLTSGEYHLREHHLRELDFQSNPSTFLTQGNISEELEWPSNNPLIDVKQ